MGYASAILQMVEHNLQLPLNWGIGLTFGCP